MVRERAVWLLAAMISLAGAMGAQNQPVSLSQESLKQLKQLRDLALQDDYAYQQLAYLTDSIGPRPSGSAQANAAAKHLAMELGRLGFEVRLEPVKVPQWVRGEETAELVSYPGQVPGTRQKIVVTALAAPGVATPPEGITADVVVVRDLAELSFLPAEKVKGRIVLFNMPFDHQMASAGRAMAAYGDAVRYRHMGRPAAAMAGAAASLVRSVGSAEYRLPHTGSTDHDAKVPQIPAGAITAEDADLIARLSKQGPVTMHLVLRSTLLPNVDSFNVLADLKGSEHAEQVVILGGHLDSWDLGTGAIDDGAGVAVSMAALKLIKQLGLQPKRTLRFVAFMNEEMDDTTWTMGEPDSAGGRMYAKTHASELANHFAAIECDTGAGHPLGFYYNGDDTIPLTMQPLAEVLLPMGASVVEWSDDTGADLVAMAIEGVPTFTPMQDDRKYFDYHHTAADTLDKVTPQELRENAAVMAVLGYALANMEQPLPRKKMKVPEWMK